MLAALTSSNPVLSQATEADAPAIERLLDLSFGKGRHRKTAQRLRDERAPAPGLAFVLKQDGVLIGTLTFWEVDAGGAPALLLGPIAIDPAYRSEGLGGFMIRRGLAEAAWLGHGAVILVGDEPYYRRFGFTRRPVEQLTLPGPVDLDRFLGLELVDGALDMAAGAVIPAARQVERRRRAA